MKKSKPNYGLIVFLLISLAITTAVWTIAIVTHTVPVLLALYGVYFVWIARQMQDSQVRRKNKE